MALLSGCMISVWDIYVDLLDVMKTVPEYNSTLPSSAFTQVSHWSHNTHTANRHLAVVEKGTAQRRTKVSFDRTMMQALELLWLVKKYILGGSDID